MRVTYRAYALAGGKLSDTPPGRVLGQRARPAVDLLDSVIRRVLHPRLPGACCIHGFRLSFPAEGYFPLEVSSGAYEPKTTAVFERLLRPGMAAIDVGAHVGYYSLVAAQLVGTEGHVYAFEPDPISFGYLVKNIYDNDFESVVTAAPLAVADAPGDAHLYRGRRDRVGNSILKIDGVTSAESTCKTTSLDELGATLGWRPIDLVKLDIEGAEILALRGMRELVRRNPEINVILEFFPRNLASAGHDPVELFTTLQDIGLDHVSTIGTTVTPMRLPDDVPAILERAGPSFVNLLCQRNG
jgi:FkbM family methyltransferase